MTSNNLQIKIRCIDFKQGERLCHEIIEMAKENGFIASGVTNLPNKKGDFEYLIVQNRKQIKKVIEGAKINSMLFTVFDTNSEFILMLERIYIPSGINMSFKNKVKYDGDRRAKR